MTDRSPVPYRAAAAVTLAVLAGYVLTLAPTVTFWDAGEFIAAARTLGIPHPPGTPLFVMIAHVWGMLVPVGEYAAADQSPERAVQRRRSGRVLPRRARDPAHGGGARPVARLRDRGRDRRVHLHQLAELERNGGVRGRHVHHRGDGLDGHALAPPARGAAGRATAAARGIPGRDLDRQPPAGAAGRARDRGVPGRHAAVGAGRGSGRPASGMGTGGGRGGHLGPPDRHGSREYRTGGARRAVLRDRGRVRGARRGGHLRSAQSGDRSRRRHAVPVPVSASRAAPADQRGGTRYARRPPGRHPSRAISAADPARRPDCARPEAPIPVDRCRSWPCSWGTTWFGSIGSGPARSRGRSDRCRSEPW